MLTTFRVLIKYGARLDLADSNGLNVLQHAIKKNNEGLVRFIISNSQYGQVSHRDHMGMTPAHTCVRPFAFGSYENKEILNLLHRNGYDLSA